MGFSNCYDDVSRAAAYATLEFANTYFLAYRDLPAIVSEHLSKQIPPVRALDFGCSTGRSTRFLRQLGFDVTGVDISENMLRIAHEFDPAGDYRLAPEDKLGELALGTFDLVLSVFTFDNIPHTSKVTIFGNLRTACATRSFHQYGLLARDLPS